MEEKVVFLVAIVKESLAEAEIAGAALRTLLPHDQVVVFANSQVSPVIKGQGPPLQIRYWASYLGNRAYNSLMKSMKQWWEEHKEGPFNFRTISFQNLLEAREMGWKFPGVGQRSKDEITDYLATFGLDLPL